MDTNSIDSKQAIAIFFILSANTIILSASQMLINYCGSSSLLNVLFIACLLIVISGIFLLLTKKFSKKRNFRNFRISWI